ncbi:hypothetical protein [uncultured Herbaspirillum sp.]|jgi:hypothetical protein|uniref:hypothetical protein n=1 Tax=uncultured Herbaspirillum sp. TaxID=160236 RepID=UPI00260798D6|nr:hypothetical protein [uncultured Herbaspirillum sp.]
MTTVFIAGSISIRHLHPKVQERIMNIVRQEFDVVVGDADGADKAIQHFLHAMAYRRVTVFCSGQVPRNNIGQWPVHHIHTTLRPGTRAFFTAKDIAMADIADSGLMIWDAKSTGTLGNVIELLNRQKYSWVFIAPPSQFLAVKCAERIEALLSCMSASARLQAQHKLGLERRLPALHVTEKQSTLFAQNVSDVLHAAH